MNVLIAIMLLLLCPIISSAEVIFENDPFAEYEHVVYEQYSYFDACYNAASYTGTIIAFEGVAALSLPASDDAHFFYVNTSREEDKSVLLVVEGAADFADSFSPGDTVSVKGMAMGVSPDFGFPGQSPVVSPFTIEIIEYGPLSPKYCSALTKAESIGYVKKGVNVRSAPDSSSAKVGYLKQGEQVSVTEENYIKGWHQISYCGVKCYVSAKYIDIK